VLGQHAGTHRFTVGQRRGLRVDRPAADGKPRYVLDISPVSRTVTVGTVEELDIGVVVAQAPRWCGPAPVAAIACLAQVRAHGRAVPAVAEVVGAEVHVELDEPLRGVAPGQAVVLYDRDRVIGSATISSTRAAVRTPSRS
jgi:tRNA-specific 2-thiouridylase